MHLQIEGFNGWLDKRTVIHRNSLNIGASKKFRKKKGLSANGLAKKAGISTSTMSYLVNGKTKPQLYTLLVICNVLGISIGDLFEEEKSSTEKEKTEEKSEEKLLACYRQLSDEKKKMLQTYVEMLREYEG